MFNYKLRPGHAEFFRLKDRTWLPFDRLEPRDWMYHEVLEKLKALKEYFQDIPSLMFTIGIFRFLNRPGNHPKMTDYNVLLSIDCKPGSPYKSRIKVAWDPGRELYILFFNPPESNAGILAPQEERTSAALPGQHRHEGDFSHVEELLEKIRLLVPGLQ